MWRCEICDVGFKETMDFSLHMINVHKWTADEVQESIFRQLREGRL